LKKAVVLYDIHGSEKTEMDLAEGNMIYVVDKSHEVDLFSHFANI
jgi:hypothetical protein